MRARTVRLPRFTGIGLTGCQESLSDVTGRSFGHVSPPGTPMKSRARGEPPGWLGRRPGDVTHPETSSHGSQGGSQRANTVIGAHSGPHPRG